MLFVWILLSLILFLILATILLKLFKKVKKMPKRIKKEKKVKIKKQEKVKNQDANKMQGSFVSLVDKFLFRKEVKLLVLISKILPKGYVIFPKISLSSILEPIGKKDLFSMVENRILDFVIFEEVTMKPVVAVDVFDGSIGDEQLNENDENVVKALKIANLPIVSFKVKTDYTEDEIKTPIINALGVGGEIKKDENRN